MEQNQEIKLKAIRLTFLIGTLLMGVKFIAFWLTGSMAILTDALESIINVGAGAFAWFSLKLSMKPRDKEHPYGHGKIEYISAGFEGGLIIMAAMYILYEAAMSFIHPRDIRQLDTGILLTAAAGLVNYFLGSSLVKTGKKHHSPTLVADGKHLLTDTWSSLGLIVGLGLVYFTKLNWLDGVISVALGIGIVITGIGLLKSSLSGLMDEADEEKLEQIAKVLEENRRNEWIDMHNVRMLKYGSLIHVDAHLTLPWYYSLEQAHEQVNALEELVADKFHAEVELFIHADPCIASSCSICQLAECKQRKQPTKSRITWSSKELLANQKHGV